VLWNPRPVDLEAMDTAADGLIGEHDFAAYCKQRPQQSTVRTLSRFGWRRNRAGLIVADVQADAFCHHMVRALVGACLAVGEGRRDPAWPARVLAGRVKDPAVSVVPAHGLTLEEVCYPPVGELAARVQETRRRRPALEDRSAGG
jgi:tRNA pseudouridine38-40 synthase